MSGTAIVLLLLLRVADQRGFHVNQLPKETSIPVGGNVTFYCVFPIIRDKSSVKVYWWKEGENAYQHSDVANGKRYGLRGRASWYFELCKATVQDSGVYRCSVIGPEMVAINGSGSRLIVHDSRNTLANYLVPSGVVVGLLILVLMIVVGVRLGRQELEGEEECGMEPNGHQDQREENNMVHYVAIHFDTSRKATKQKRLDARHAFDQKMQGEPAQSIG
ncbi:uncharacterized protein [Narcine bancroftii]|uniref:uncharacterized protein isoform X2 n=1 Tax=Narcine bancroftii TaxID=1343680 RepID=UPI0038322AB2